jgi:hypothetical protein
MVVVKIENKRDQVSMVVLHEEIFQDFKRFLMTTLVLILPNFNEDFLVCINANGECIRGVLMKEEKIVIYKSRKLNVHKKKYLSHELKILVIV